MKTVLANEIKACVFESPNYDGKYYATLVLMADGRKTGQTFLGPFATWEQANRIADCHARRGGRLPDYTTVPQRVRDYATREIDRILAGQAREIFPH